MSSSAQPPLPAYDPQPRASVVDELRAAQAQGRRPSVTSLAGQVLHGEDLQGVDLSGFDLRGADLSEANLSGANLSNADLTEAILYRTNLDRAELLGARLPRVAASECSAERAGFAHADLTGAELFGAKLSDATFTQATLESADLRAAVLEGARFREAKLHGANLTRARLRSADLLGCDVAGADFHGADLREAGLREMVGYESAHWIGVDLRDVNFAGAYMLRRHISDENYLHEFRTRSRTSAAVYWVWWLTSDCGRSLTRWFGLNAIIALLFAAIYSQINVDWGDHETWLSPFYFSVVTLTTLGYGDVLPASPLAQTAAIIQVLIGYLGLGGLLSILSNKMARRAE